MDKNGELDLKKFLLTFLVAGVIVTFTSTLIIWSKSISPLFGDVVGWIIIFGYIASIVFYCYKMSKYFYENNIAIIFYKLLVLFISFGLFISIIITIAEITHTKDLTSTKAKYPIETVTKTKEREQNVFKITYIKNKTPHTVTISEEKLPDFTISRKGNYLEVETFSSLKQGQGCDCSGAVPEEKYKIVGEKK